MLQYFMSFTLLVSLFSVVCLTVITIFSIYKWLHWKTLALLAQKESQLLDSQTQQKEDMANFFKETIKTMSNESVLDQSEKIIQLTEQTLAKHTESAKKNMDRSSFHLESLVSPLKKSLEDIQTQSRAMEKERQRSYSLVEEELKKVVESSQYLSKETRSLKDALKKPHVRGRWGEVQLKNCVELAGMSSYADVSFQDVKSVDDDKKLIPDMTVRMPGGRLVIVDAKTPLDAFLSSLETTTEEARMVELKRHGLQVKDHIRKLSAKAYGERLMESADFTVMFLPNESFLYAALEVEPDLIEYALQRKILVATPPTLVGLLKVIRYGWNEEKLAKNAEVIWETGVELHKRIVDFTESYESVGKGLKTAQTKYEEGMKRLNSRVLVQVRRLESLGIKSQKELKEDLGIEALSPN